jgi:hypothetical protein
MCKWELDPLSIKARLGDKHDSKKLVKLIEGLALKPKELYADSAYDSARIRAYLRSRGIEGKHTNKHQK